MSMALLVIDVQRGLFDAEPRPFEADAVIERINGLTGRARAADVPVVFVQHESASLPVDSDAWRFAAGLQVQSRDAIVRKATPDAFLRTELPELLTSWQIDRLVICGYACEFCIDTTTRRAAALGYGVTLAADAHTTHDKPHATAAQIRVHENATLSDLTSFGPVIAAVPSADIAFR
ncbi:MAG: cysteine hydrolase family protein [Vicinamibacteraceae bacterium]